MSDFVLLFKTLGSQALANFPSMFYGNYPVHILPMLTCQFLLYMRANLKSTVRVDSFDQWNIASRYTGI